MSYGYLYGTKEPTEACPYCKTECRADFVDVGVGFTQCGPYHCEKCGASQIGSYDDEKRKLSAEEKRTGWYGPDQPPSDKANAINGKVVSHKEMLKAYQAEFVNNPAYHVDGEVAKWFQKIRIKKDKADSFNYPRIRRRAKQIRTQKV